VTGVAEVSGALGSKSGSAPELATANPDPARELCAGGRARLLTSALAPFLGSACRLSSRLPPGSGECLRFPSDLSRERDRELERRRRRRRRRKLGEGRPAGPGRRPAGPGMKSEMGREERFSKRPKCVWTTRPCLANLAERSASSYTRPTP